MLESKEIKTAINIRSVILLLFFKIQVLLYYKILIMLNTIVIYFFINYIFIMKK